MANHLVLTLLTGLGLTGYISALVNGMAVIRQQVPVVGGTSAETFLMRSSETTGTDMENDRGE